MNNDKILITGASRTAVGSLGKTLKNTPADDLGAKVILDQITKSKIKKMILMK